jgi:ADP-ribosylglycohydrolase
LPAGGTTDDTRWKKLFVNYATEEPWPNLRAASFAEHILHKYTSDIEVLKSTEGIAPAPYEENLMKMAWLQEWAVVADAYNKNDMDEYAKAVNKFYGGEMTCAGMLYSPLVGACSPADPNTAYQSAYNLSIFDIGYARDITALMAAMVSQAFDNKANKESLVQVIRTVDPNDYFKSRLVGRAAYRFYQQSNSIVSASKSLTRKDFPSDFRIPREWQPMDSLTYLQLSRAYTLLDEYNQDMPFHAAEIYQITLTAMLYCDYDFECTMEFIVNYGRDNDTAAAVAGAILGAYWGADKLPQEKVGQLLKVNKELLGNDLEELARAMTEKYMK